MRLLPLFAALAMTACTTAEAQDPTSDPTGIEWQLLAIDGQIIDIPATLTLNANGSVAGKAPCNSYGGQNRATLPDLALPALRATRMACDRLADEKTYFTALSEMTRLERSSASTLVLTGADGRSMEFARDLQSSQTRCTTCAPQD
ncbi:MAG: META domain-containing protein [Pseudomonadota bacterium]